MSKIGTETVTVDQQGDTSFCWLFAVAFSIVQSMWTRLGFFLSSFIYKKKFSEKVPDEETKNRAAEFLNRKDLRQIIRREICFGLIPKTLTRE